MEAGGIEPPSEDLPVTAATRLVKFAGRPASTPEAGISLQLLPPFGPIDFRRLDDFQVDECDLIGEQDQVVA